jgi:hypothetical protein
MSLTDTGAAQEAVTQREALVRELAERDFEARVTSDGRTPSLTVTNPLALGSRHVIAVTRVNDCGWWFWWPWGARIARIGDVGTAAFKIAYVLPHPQPADPPC